MISRQEKAGRALLNNWKTRSALVRVSVSHEVGGGSDIEFDGTGHIEDCFPVLRIRGEGFILCLDLREADFDNVAFETDFLKAGLNPDEFPEGLTLELSSGDRIDLSASPPPVIGKPN